jgi:Tfp pilus assembly protein PilF
MARTTTFSFKGKTADPSAIGRTLGVSAVLTGRVVQLGDTLMVQADLVNVSDGSQLWGGRFNGKATDLMLVQEEIAQKIVDKLSLRLSSAERDRLMKRYTENVEAYRSYLKGRYEWNKRTGDGLKSAINLFNQAIALDPTYALAHAGLADTYALLPQYANAPFEESLNKAKAASLKALEFDNSLAEGHISLASVKQSIWEWEGVQEGYQRGLALNPNYATAHQWYSEYLVPMGRIAEAQKEIRLAQQLDPMSLIINVRVGMTSYFARQYDLAEKQLRDALQFDPDFILTNLFLSHSLIEQDKFEAAIPYLVKGVFNGYSASDRMRFESAIRAAHEKAGAKGGLETVRDLLLRSEKRDYSYPMLMALTAMHLEDKDAAFIWLNRAADLKHPGVPTLRIDPAADFLRTDPRFPELMKRLGI